jgi:hypothetical protein
MQDLDTAKTLLKKNNDTLVIVKNGKVLFETNSSGIHGLLAAIEKIGKGLKTSAVADKLVGEAAAQLCAYSSVLEVFAVTLSKCGKDVLEKNNIRCEYENFVPHILNQSKTDLCPFEKIVAGSSSPRDAFERLKRAASQWQS